MKEKADGILRNIPLVLVVVGMVIALFPATSIAQGMGGFVGSWECKECHEETYNQWIRTPHARMLRNAYQDPEAVEATDFKGIPFQKKDIYFTIGSHWIQKYMTLLGGQFYVLPRYWNISEAKWEPYSIWNWNEQPYPLYCNGCHAVGFDMKTRSYKEEAIGCESCHGPGERHVDNDGDISMIVNPGKLTKQRRDMICEACHTDGKDTKTQTFPFPAGYIAGEDLGDYYTDFFMPKPKSKGWYWGTMDYAERHRMFMFWQTKFYATDRACEVCGFDRGITVTSARYMSRSEYCGTCHREIYPRYADHALHKEAQAECVDCHTPSVTSSGAQYSIHDHRFDFSRPEVPCAECHDDPMEGKVPPPEKPHEWHIKPVKSSEVLTVAQACSRCHSDRDQGWIDTNLERIRSQGFKVTSVK